MSSLQPAMEVSAMEPCLGYGSTWGSVIQDITRHTQWMAALDSGPGRSWCRTATYLHSETKKTRLFTIFHCNYPFLFEVCLQE